MDLNIAECLKDRMAEVHDLRLEINRLRAALNEIAHHRIDSKLASLEKRGMAQRALNGPTGDGR